MLRWGLLGAASVTDRHLAPAMRAAGHDLAVIGARSRTRAQAFAAGHGVRRARGSYMEVLEASDVDAVYVALPNDLHEQWTIRALQAGKHVLCEKPLAVSADAAERMAAAAATAGRVVCEAVMTRFHPRTAALLDLVHTGGIGDLREMHAAFSYPMRSPGSFRASEAHGGGALLDVGVYPVALCRWLTGDEPKRVAAVQRRWPAGVDGVTAAVLAFPRGPVAMITVSFEALRHERLTVVGTDGVIEVPRAFTAGADTEAVLVRDGREVGSWRADPYETMVRAFAQTVAGQAPSLPPEDGVATARVLDAIAAAAR